jgi:hypothetical protein
MFLISFSNLSMLSLSSLSIFKIVDFMPLIGNSNVLGFVGDGFCKILSFL